eukprot:ANDGO_01787.mRNA.1 hypothetical protein
MSQQELYARLESLRAARKAMLSAASDPPLLSPTVLPPTRPAPTLPVDKASAKITESRISSAASSSPVLPPVNCDSDPKLTETSIIKKFFVIPSEQELRQRLRQLKFEQQQSRKLSPKRSAKPTKNPGHAQMRSMPTEKPEFSCLRPLNSDLPFQSYDDFVAAKKKNGTGSSNLESRGSSPGDVLQQQPVHSSQHPSPLQHQQRPQHAADFRLQAQRGSEPRHVTEQAGRSANPVITNHSSVSRNSFRDSRLKGSDAGDTTAVPVFYLRTPGKNTDDQPVFRAAGPSLVSNAFQSSHRVSAGPFPFESSSSVSAVASPASPGPSQLSDSSQRRGELDDRSVVDQQDVAVVMDDMQSAIGRSKAILRAACRGWRVRKLIYRGKGESLRREITDLTQMALQMAAEPLSDPLLSRIQNQVLSKKAELVLYIDDPRSRIVLGPVDIRIKKKVEKRPGVEWTSRKKRSDSESSARATASEPVEALPVGGKNGTSTPSQKPSRSSSAIPTAVPAAEAFSAPADEGSGPSGSAAASTQGGGPLVSTKREFLKRRTQRSIIPKDDTKRFAEVPSKIAPLIRSSSFSDTPTNARVSRNRSLSNSETRPAAENVSSSAAAPRATSSAEPPPVMIPRLSLDFAKKIQADELVSHETNIHAPVAILNPPASMVTTSSSSTEMDLQDVSPLASLFQVDSTTRIPQLHPSNAILHSKFDRHMYMDLVSDFRFEKRMQAEGRPHKSGHCLEFAPRPRVMFMSAGAAV